MKRFSIVLVFAICLVIAGCPIEPEPNPITTTSSVSQPDMYCENMYDVGRCSDGSYPQACVSYDQSRCGFKVKGRMFYCYNCVPLICDDAASAAISYCYNYGSTLSEDGIVNIEEVLSTKDMFLEALEELK